MKTKILFLTTAAALLGSLTLNAQDAPKPPGEGGPRGGGDPQARMEEMMKKIDTNGDGKISKEEWLEFSRKEADDRFSKLDTNNDGSVDKAEMEEGGRKMRGQGGGGERPGGFRKPEGGEGGGTKPQPPSEGAQRPGTGGGLREIYKKIEETGSISKEEFSKMNEEQFNKIDTNKDGKITKDEMEEAMKKMREMMGGRGQGGPGGAKGGERPQGGPGAAPGPGGEGGFRKRPQ